MGYNADGRGSVTAEIVRRALARKSERGEVIAVRVGGQGLHAETVAVVIEGRRIQLRALPVGMLAGTGVYGYIPPETLVNVSLIAHEVKALRDQGWPVDKLHVSPLCREGDGLWLGDDSRALQTLEDLGVWVTEHDKMFDEADTVVVEGRDRRGVSLLAASWCPTDRLGKWTPWILASVDLAGARDYSDLADGLVGNGGLRSGVILKDIATALPDLADTKAKPAQHTGLRADLDRLVVDVENGAGCHVVAYMTDPERVVWL